MFEPPHAVIVYTNSFTLARGPVLGANYNVYAALQGGSIMKGWTNSENMMITCCNDGIRPVIFKLERIDEDEDE
jgi:hypothetical protein